MLVCSSDFSLLFTPRLQPMGWRHSPFRWIFLVQLIQSREALGHAMRLVSYVILDPVGNSNNDRHPLPVPCTGHSHLLDDNLAHTAIARQWRPWLCSTGVWGPVLCSQTLVKHRRPRDAISKEMCWGQTVEVVGKGKAIVSKARNISGVTLSFHLVSTYQAVSMHSALC